MEPFVYVAGAVLVGILLILVTFLRKSVSEGTGQDVAEPQAAAARPRPAPRAAEAPPGARRRAPRNRMAAGRQLEESDEDGNEDPLNDIALPEGKVGAKKLAKLQAKAEKKTQRQAEIQEREEQKRRQALLEEERKKDEAREAAVEAARAEEEKRRKEEEEARQHEEYLLLKQAFTVEEEGTHEEELNQDTDSLLQQFIDYIQDMKVVMLEDLAAHFKLKTQEAIDRVQELQAEGRLQGLMDDRGKFISITQSELEAVAKFIRQRGRVSISELAECSNQLINLNHDKETLQRLAVPAEVKAS